jgi:hypothetical protein
LSEKEKEIKMEPVTRAKEKREQRRKARMRKKRNIEIVKN